MGVITRLIEVYRASRANLLVRFCSTRQEAGTTGCGFAVAWPLGREDGLIAVCPRQRASQEEAASAARKSNERQAKSNKKQTKIDKKSMKKCFRAVLGAQSCFGDAPGHARDRPGTPKSRPRVDAGAAGARQNRPKPVQNPARAVPKSVRDDSGAVSKRCSCAKLC